MDEMVSVRFRFKANTAKSIPDLTKRSGHTSHAEMTAHALNCYIDLVRDFNNGFNILEIDSKTGAEKCIDVFNEAANAPIDIDAAYPISKSFSDQLKKVFKSNNLSPIFTNAYFFYDRAIDTVERGACMVSRHPDKPIKGPVP